MAINIIDNATPDIVVKENTVHLSDEKLQNILLRTYERAQQDMNTMKFHKFYSIFISIAGTLFLTLLTSTFNSIGQIKAEAVTICVWVICVISAIVGFGLMAYHVSQKTKNDTSERDKAVEEIFNQYCSQ